MTANGSKLGMHTTKKLAGEDFKRPWSPLIKMDEAMKAKVEKLFGHGTRHLGQERRDVIAHNKADTGFWKDLKEKFKSSEILFEAKHKIALERDDLRQTYCYLKESIGYWGFLVFCGPKDESALAYNRTLYRNFNGYRGVLILNHEDFRKMVEIKIRNDDPTDYLRNLYSKFNQEI